MKVFNLILILTALVVYITGVVWYFIDKSKGGHKKAPIILRIIGSLLMTAYFVILIIRNSQ